MRFACLLCVRTSSAYFHGYRLKLRTLLQQRHPGYRSCIIPDCQRTHDVALDLGAPALNQLQNRLAIRRPAHAGSRCANMASSRCVAASSRALAWV